MSLRLSGASRVVATALRAHFGKPPRDRLLSTTDTAALVRCARQEGLSGLVWHELRRLAPEHPALPALDASRLRAFGGAARTLELIESLGGALSERGTSAVILKGGALLTTVYRSHLDLRPLSDLDLLALPGSMALVRETLLDLDFRRHGPVWCRDGLEIDLHEDLLGNTVTGRRRSPFVFEQSLVESETDASRIGGPGLRILRPELQFLHAAVHALRHDYRRWLWILDLSLLLRDCQWERLHSLARQTNTERPLAYGLAACVALVDAPTAARRAQALPKLSRLESAYLKVALDRPSGVHLGEVLAGLSHLDWRRRLACWAELLAPAPDLLGLRLPRARRTDRRRLWTVSALRSGLGDGFRLFVAALRPDSFGSPLTQSRRYA